MKRFSRGQGTLEYVIIFAVIVGAIILVAGRFKGHVRGAYSHLAGKMDNAVNPPPTPVP